MTIHTDDPFPPERDDPARRLRSRIGGRVTLWTAGPVPSADLGGSQRSAGLTVTSILLAGGEPWRALGLLDPDADLTDRLLHTGSAVIHLVDTHDRALAEAFSGLVPAAGGPFRRADWVGSSWGPRLATAQSWMGVRLVDAHQEGWSLLVTCVIEHAEVGADDDPLVHRRGRYNA